ncbi:MAG TPA: sulfatase-like hydrolase/transferase [Humisphaera sp.]
MPKPFSLVALLVAVLAPAGALAAPPRPPNIVVILADDLGYETLGCNGGTSYPTPALDRLAAEGVRFTRGYAQPLCTPTRVQLMTGQYNVRNYTRFGHIDPASTTFAQVLKKAGYATAIVGKWQLGQGPGLPQKLGFDDAYLWQHTRRPPRYANPGLEHNGKPLDFNDGEYGPDLLQKYAEDWLGKQKDGPFLLYYTMTLTHDPFQPTPDSPDWDPKAVGEQVNRSPKHFGDMVRYMDKLLGKLVARLDELKVRDDTLILFIGDNGTSPAITSTTTAGPFRGGKGSATDAGMHVPFIANWPARWGKGRTCDDLVDTTDVLPTLLAAAGVAAPEGLVLDGRSFLPQLRGEAGSPREWTYCWYARNGGAKAAAEFAMDKRFKLYRDGRMFDVAADPGEAKPLADKAGDDAAAAKAKLKTALGRYADARPEAVSKQAGKGNGKEE